MTRHRRHQRERSSERDESDSSCTWSHSYGRRHKQIHTRSDTNCHIKRHSRYRDFSEYLRKSSEVWCVESNIEPYVIRGGRRVRCRCDKRDGLQEDIYQPRDYIFQSKKNCLACEKPDRKSSRRTHSCSVRLPDLCILCPAEAAKKIKCVPEYLMIQSPTEVSSYENHMCAITLPGRDIAASTGSCSGADNQMECFAGRSSRNVRVCRYVHSPESKANHELKECVRRRGSNIKVIKVLNERKYSSEEDDEESESSQSPMPCIQSSVNNPNQRVNMFLKKSADKYEYFRSNVFCWKQKTGLRNMGRVFDGGSTPPAQQRYHYASTSHSYANGKKESTPGKVQPDQRCLDLQNNKNKSNGDASHLHDRWTTASPMMSQPVSELLACRRKFTAENSCNSETFPGLGHPFHQQPVDLQYQSPNRQYFEWNRNSSISENDPEHNTTLHSPSYTAAEHELGNMTQSECRRFWESNTFQNNNESGNVHSVYPFISAPNAPRHETFERVLIEEQKQEQSPHSHINNTLAPPAAALVFKVAPLKHVSINTEPHVDRERPTTGNNFKIQDWKSFSQRAQYEFRCNETQTTEGSEKISRRTVFTQTKPQTLKSNTTAVSVHSNNLNWPKFMTRGTAMRKFERIISPRRNWGTQTLPDAPKQQQSLCLERNTLCSQAKVTATGKIGRNPKSKKESSTNTVSSNVVKPRLCRSLENVPNKLRCKLDNSKTGLERQSSFSWERLKDQNPCLHFDKRLGASKASSLIKFDKIVQVGPVETKEIALQSECPSMHNLQKSRSLCEYTTPNSIFLPQVSNYQLKSNNSDSVVCDSIPGEQKVQTLVPTDPVYGMRMPYVSWPYPMCPFPTTTETNGSEYVIKCKIELDGHDGKTPSTNPKWNKAKVTGRPEQDEVSGRIMTQKSEKTTHPPAQLVRKQGYFGTIPSERIQQPRRLKLEEQTSKTKTGVNHTSCNRSPTRLTDDYRKPSDRSDTWTLEIRKPDGRPSVERVKGGFIERTTLPTNQLPKTDLTDSECRTYVKEESPKSKDIQQPIKLSEEKENYAGNTELATTVKIQRSKLSPVKFTSPTDKPVAQVERVEREGRVLRAPNRQSQIRPGKEARKNPKQLIQNDLRPRL